MKVMRMKDDALGIYNTFAYGNLNTALHTTLENKLHFLMPILKLPLI